MLKLAASGSGKAEIQRLLIDLKLFSVLWLRGCVAVRRDKDSYVQLQSKIHNSPRKTDYVRPPPPPLIVANGLYLFSIPVGVSTFEISIIASSGILDDFLSSLITLVSSIASIVGT